MSRQPTPPPPDPGHSALFGKGAAAVPGALTMPPIVARLTPDVNVDAPAIAQAHARRADADTRIGNQLRPVLVMP